MLLIIPYFTEGKGSLPNLFPLWLASCKRNPTVNWLLVTDTKFSDDVPKNVKVLKMSFDEMRKRIQDLFDFPICLEKAYKLCDFKPTYGAVFADEAKGYDFWGFCDMDLIWGDIRAFITDDVLKDNKRILTSGHFTLFKNDDEMRNAYKTLDPMGVVDYKSVFTSPKSFCFDEWGGMSEILKRNNVKMYHNRVFADIQIDRFHLRPTREFSEKYYHEKKRKNLIYSVRDGKVICFYNLNGQLGSEEFMYIHFQKRHMSIEKGVDPDKFLIAPPNLIMKYTDVNLDKIKKLNRYTGLKWNPKGQMRRFARKAWYLARGKKLK
jgi:hypothetical protein